MIGVHGLYIYDNYITRCMRRNLAQVARLSPAGCVRWNFVSKGGIDLRILRNEIIANGNSHLQPICGVFALIVQGLQLDDNRIIGNGPRTQEPAGNAQTGIRGGVHIWIILPVIEQSSSFSPTHAVVQPSIRNGVSSCAMRDNIIVAPMGRAVTFLVLGQTVVARNRLVSQGASGRGLI